MDRRLLQVRLGDGRVRFVSRVEGDELDDEVPDHVAQDHFMRVLFENPRLLECGPVRWRKLTVYHDRGRWVAEAEAIAKPQEVVP